MVLLYISVSVEAPLQIRHSQTQQPEMASTFVPCFIFNGLFLCYSAELF